MDISVKVHFPSGEISRGVITYTTNGPRLVSVNSSDVIDENERVEISVIENISRDNIEIMSDTRFEYQSQSVVRKYSIESAIFQEMYPPSSRGWITHLSETGSNAIFSVQRIVGENRYLLSVVDFNTGEVRRIHPVHSYEIDLLLMETDWNRYNRIMIENSEGFDEIPLEELLDKPAPTWFEITQLVEGVNIPNLARGTTMRETMEQLVPVTFPENIRIELIAFLSYIINLEIPKEDPLDFQVSMRRRFQSAPLLRLLLYCHIQCLLEGIKPPQYVKIMAMENRGLLGSGLEPAPTEMDPWAMTWHRLMEMFPDNQSRVANIAHQLNQIGEIRTSLPITRQDARNSNNAWVDRFSMIRNGLMVRGYVQEQKLGLEMLSFMGRTNRWPHKHLAWSARLGPVERNPPYIQVMVVPKSVVPTITRLIKKSAIINWSANRINYGLFNHKKGKWKANLTQIAKSFSQSGKLSQISREFGIPRTREIKSITETEARVIDFTSFGFYLASLELGDYDTLLRMNTASLENILRSFQEQGIIQLDYFSYFSGLVSVCLEIKGHPNQLYSIARGLLKYLPSARILISEEKRICYLLGRVPEESAYEIFTEFPAKAANYNIELKGYRVTAYVDYLHNLHQRLLTAEGTWDDDISGLVSQMRS